METKAEVVVAGGYKVHVERCLVDEAWPTVILVNGAVATTASFRQTAKYLIEHFNVVLYDLPYAGQSKPHNTGRTPLTNDEEAEILLSLIDKYGSDHLVSASWGGVAALLALATSPKSIKSAVVASFSPVLNDAMFGYMTGVQAFLEARDLESGADLLNNTVGKYLPRLLKLFNHRYLVTLTEHEYVQIAFHIQQILALDVQLYIEKLSAIKIPVLFINGEFDEYTTINDSRSLSRYIENSQFVAIPGAGHFLDLESKRAWRETRSIINGFLLGHWSTGAQAGAAVEERGHRLECPAGDGWVRRHDNEGGRSERPSFPPKCCDG